MGLNLLLLVVGLVICFGGIYIRKVCSAILGLIWGALCSFAVILMTVGLWGIDDETFIIVAVCAIACALISVIYDKLCAAINAFLSSFFLVAILLLMADSMESATLIIIAAVIALIVSIISVKIYNYSFIIMTAFSGAFIASIGGCGIIYNADASRVFLNLMLGDDVAGFILIGTLVLGVLGCIVQWRRLKGKTANGANTGHKTTVSENTAGAFAPAEKASIQNPFVREIKENWGLLLAPIVVTLFWNLWGSRLLWTLFPSIVNGHRFRGQPAIALDESHAVGSPAAQPVGTDKIFVAADTVRVLFQLVGKECFGQHIAVGAPDIAPTGFPCVDSVGHKVSGIFAVGIGESRDVQVDTAAISAKELTAVIPAARSAGDHGIDVVDIALVVLCDRPAKLCFQIGIRLIQ